MFFIEKYVKDEKTKFSLKLGILVRRINIAAAGVNLKTRQINNAKNTSSTTKKTINIKNKISTIRQHIGSS